ncbi:uncharacterized protein [Physcomitrium patens]|uniref:uncharacterized protein n=1 Tax=Physcomitrium patens TaxID=3218 RepID=UPI003CCD1095
MHFQLALLIACGRGHSLCQSSTGSCFVVGDGRALRIVRLERGDSWQRRWIETTGIHGLY